MRNSWFLGFLFGFVFFSVTYSQTDTEIFIEKTDTIKSEPIVIDPASASEYIHSLIETEDLWRTSGDTMKLSLSRLVDHFIEPFDSVRSRLSEFPFEALELQLTAVSKSDTLPLLWIDKNTFIIDTALLDRDPFIRYQTIVLRTLEVDTSVFNLHDSIPDLTAMIDSLFHSSLRVKDTINEYFPDYKYLASQKIPVFRIADGNIDPPILPAQSRKTANFISDSASIIITETSEVFIAGSGTPFYIAPGERMPDSLSVAVETLLTYVSQRDSIQLFINDIRGNKTDFWLSSGKDDLIRYWVKNAENDSITIWLGNPQKFELSLILEDDVSVERLQKKVADDIPIVVAKPKRTLAKLKPLEEIPVYWSYNLLNSFSLNQTYLANWSKGGQSSLSGMLDVRGEATYANKKSKETWTNNARLRYGSIRTREQGLRTSTDIFEINSQYNRVILDRLDFSSVFYGKTQITKGFNYPNDSVVISKFLNPGTFTIGAGVEYKPFKETLINFSVLSYKNTFVLDTTNILQTTHGIAAGKRSKQEMGGQLVIKNKTSILDGLNISNSIRLFSNYLEKPQNVDVDWEVSIDKQINWFFAIRLNLHLIYDDDIRFPVLDNEGNQVLLPDGTPKKVAKTQFNQFLGLTLSLKI